MYDFICPHCGKEYDKDDNITEIDEICLDDAVKIVRDYCCPHCKGFIRGTQQGEIVYWQPETFEVV